ncbi:helix-turn-helix domain-containing protein [Oceanobacillus jeddahense]|uniref:helix-turn-helix domain-containing protein n=1 Tax=Oceanobacillus jeddahense TaxID=1462527 RepID=UPI00362A5DA3
MSVLAYKVGRCLLLQRLQDAYMTQQELANEMGITVQQINKYVHNRQKMSIEVAGNIAFILGCEIKHLYEWIEVGEIE